MSGHAIFSILLFLATVCLMALRLFSAWGMSIPVAAEIEYALPGFWLFLMIVSLGTGLGNARRISEERFHGLKSHILFALLGISFLLISFAVSDSVLAAYNNLLTGLGILALGFAMVRGFLVKY